MNNKTSGPSGRLVFFLFNPAAILRPSWVALQANAQIADQLFTSPRTVESHRQNLLEKTGAKNTAALVKTAASKG